MAKPDINDGHIDIANDLSEALMRINLSGYQYRTIWCVFRKTIIRICLL
ncbi:MAG: replication protein [Candidatus Hydromicrobium sp.]